MNIGGTVGAESGNVAQELDGLQLTTELQFENVVDRNVVGRRERQSLQCGVMQVGIGSSEAANGQGHRRGRTVRHTMGIAGAQHCRGQTFAIRHITAESQMPFGEDGALQLESGAHVRSAAITGGGGTGEERKTPGEFVARLFPFLGRGQDKWRGIVKHSQNRAIRHRSQSPLPVVIIRNIADRAQLHHPEQRAQGDIYVEAGAGAKTDSLTQCREEGWRCDFKSVQTGQ